MKDKWEKQEQGWWTHPELGGVGKVGKRKWGAWPLTHYRETPAKTFTNMVSAMRWMERRKQQ